MQEHSEDHNDNNNNSHRTNKNLSSNNTDDTVDLTASYDAAWTKRGRQMNSHSGIILNKMNYLYLNCLQLNIDNQIYRSRASEWLLLKENNSIRL